MSEAKDYGLNFKWEIRGLRKYTGTDIQNAVIAVSWYVKGTDDAGLYGEYYGDSTFDTSNIDVEEFIAYENLTEDIVLGWVTDGVNLSSSYWDSIVDHVLSQIRVKSEMIVYIDEINLPWSSASGSVVDEEVSGSIE